MWLHGAPNRRCPQQRRTACTKEEGAQRMRGLVGKRVLISGGTSGIGLAAARRFLQENARVCITGLDPGEVHDAVTALWDAGETSPVTGMAGDVGREEDVIRMMDQAEAALGGIDVLINNAGIASRTPFLSITAEEWDRVLEVNLRGMFLAAQAAARRMAAQGSGVIINMSSTNGLSGEEDYAHYNASKAGVLLLTKTMAVELGRHGIRVNALCPGYIRTPLTTAIASGLGGDTFDQAYAGERIPLGRVGEADEVAAAYAFLASDDASFVHGTGLVIDGGQLALM
jgi:NAD(P)-dependent dehydrogenase (short-subunit alcohol dehydrogenase family)